MLPTMWIDSEDVSLCNPHLQLTQFPLYGIRVWGRIVPLNFQTERVENSVDEGTRLIFKPRVLILQHTSEGRGMDVLSNVEWDETWRGWNLSIRDKELYFDVEVSSV